MRKKVKGRRINHNGKEYQIATRYSLIEDAYQNPVMQTEVKLTELTDNGNRVESTPELLGKAICSISDQFSKQMGRTIAVGRALK